MSPASGLGPGSSLMALRESPDTLGPGDAARCVMPETPRNRHCRAVGVAPLRGESATRSEQGTGGSVVLAPRSEIKEEPRPRRGAGDIRGVEYAVGASPPAAAKSLHTSRGTGNTSHATSLRDGRLHAGAPICVPSTLDERATTITAATMRFCMPHRQRCRSNASRTSVSVGIALRASSAAALIRMPLAQ